MREIFSEKILGMRSGVARRVVLHEDDASTAHGTSDIIVGRCQQLGVARRVERTIVDVELGLAEMRHPCPDADFAAFGVDSDFVLHLSRTCVPLDVILGIGSRVKVKVTLIGEEPVLDVGAAIGLGKLDPALLVHTGNEELPGDLVRRRP